MQRTANALGGLNRLRGSNPLASAFLLFLLSHMDKITWQALEFQKHEKSKSWFFSLWIIALGLVIVSVLTKSIFMGVLVMVAALVISLYAAKEPREFTFTLKPKAISVGNKNYQLEDFSSFWIDEDENEANYVLILNPKKAFGANLKIFLPKEHVSNAKLILRAYLDEEEHEDSLVDNLAEWLRF